VASGQRRWIAFPYTSHTRHQFVAITAERDDDNVRERVYRRLLAG